jgi:hypothetical protein
MEKAWNGKPGKYRMEKITERAEMEIRKGKPLSGKTASEYGNRKRLRKLPMSPQANDSNATMKGSLVIFVWERNE